MSNDRATATTSVLHSAKAGDPAIAQALRQGHLIDITTTGRRSGQRRRIELTFHNFDGRIYISGRPGRRDWYANLVADGRFTFHLKATVQADLQATARPITGEAERRAVFARILEVWRGMDPDVMQARAPLVEVVIDR
jgi:deazaflavin-dependent oxidoreductase (nitroreductase family)